MTLAISKLTNACVEVGLMCLSIMLGAIGLPLWVAAVMVLIGLSWWGVVHHNRISALLAISNTKVLSHLGVAILVLSIGHGLAFVLGGALRPILGTS